jgi:hypothetical protein
MTNTKAQKIFLGIQEPSLPHGLSPPYVKIMILRMVIPNFKKSWKIHMIISVAPIQAMVFLLQQARQNSDLIMYRFKGQTAEKEIFILSQKSYIHFIYAISIDWLVNLF